MKKLQNVDGTKIFEELREHMSQVEAPVASAIGFVNWITQIHLSDPKVFINKGKILFNPPEDVSHGQGALSFFVCNDQQEGSSGCLMYNIGNTKLVFVALWSTTPQGNRFNIRCLSQRPCNQELFNELFDSSVRSSDSLLRDDNGFRIQAAMTETTKSILVVECSALISHFEDTKSVTAGTELRSECARLVKEFKGDNVCVIGLENNFSVNHLGHPQIFEETGRATQPPTAVVEPGMGTPSVFVKREFALRGSSGLLSYDIGDSKFMIVVKWQVPPKDMGGENRFNIHFLSRAILKKEISKEMESDWATAKQGKLTRTEGSMQAEATMTEDEKCLLYVTLNVHYQQ